MNRIPLLLAALAAWFHPPAPPPPAEDVQRFPPAWLCQAQLEFQDGRLSWLEGQRDFYGDPYWAEWHQEALEDATARRRCWRLALDARGEWDRGRGPPPVLCWDGAEYGLHDWRKSAEADLGELRDLLGDLDYAQSVMPGPMDARFTHR